MEEILKQLHDEVIGELGEGRLELEQLGTPIHQLKVTLESLMEEVRQNTNFNPFEITNRVLAELNRYHRLGL